MKKIKIFLGATIVWGVILDTIDIIKKSQVVPNHHIIQDVSLNVIIAVIGILIFIWGLRSNKRMEF